MRITSVRARQILDSRGNPTVEADVRLDNGLLGRAAVPSGASTGSHEAVELRDGGKAFGGKGVTQAVTHINTEIAGAIIGRDVHDQAGLDHLMIELDGTPNKGRLGANAILAVSLAAVKASALAADIPLYEKFRSLSNNTEYRLPVPLINIINGGQHAAGSTDIQEFMILPVGARSFSDGLRMATEIFHALRRVLLEQGYNTTIGDEGGFAPAVKNGNAEALRLIMAAIENAGYAFGDDIGLALDVASTELHSDGRYGLPADKKELDSAGMIGWLQELASAYPIVSIEDGLAEDDWSGWTQMTQQLGGKLQLVGDDLFVTNTKLLERGIKEQAGNAILIKPNQIGTVTETIAAIEAARAAGWRSIISHRSGETEDTTIAHLAVGLGTGQIKTGSVSRTDRTAKYNELLRIEEALGSQAGYPGRGIFS